MITYLLRISLAGKTLSQTVWLRLWETADYMESALYNPSLLIDDVSNIHGGNVAWRMFILINGYSNQQLTWRDDTVLLICYLISIPTDTRPLDLLRTMLTQFNVFQISIYDHFLYFIAWSAPKNCDLNATWNSVLDNILMFFSASFKCCCRGFVDYLIFTQVCFGL